VQAGLDQRNVEKEATQTETPIEKEDAANAISSVVALPGFKRRVYLIGLPELSEFMQQCADQPAPTDPWQLQWFVASSERAALDQTEGGIADKPAISPLPKDISPLAQRIATDPHFLAWFTQGAPPFGYVELDRLVVYQRHIDLDHVERLAKSLMPNPTPEAIFNLCFSLEQKNPPQVVQAPRDTYYVYSESTDFRYHHPPMPVNLDPALLAQQSPGGNITTGIGIAAAFGYTLNFLHVAAVDGRLVLWNGSHRAYTLRSLGLTHAPCIVQTMTRDEMVKLAGGNELGRNAGLHLDKPRPPLFRDYFDERLHVKLTKPITRRMTRVRFHVEVDPPVDIPIH
jgi:hypothetical protein